MVNGRSQIGREGNSASLRYVTPVLATLGIPFKSGRDVSEADTGDRPYVAVVSESFVRRYWPDQDPIGRHFDFGLHDREVIGVVGDVRVRGLERTSEPQVYLSYQQVPDGWIIGYTPKDLVIHSSQPPQRLIPEVRRIIAAADPQQPISNVRTMEEIVAGETESRTIQMRVLITFTAVAILLAGLGSMGCCPSRFRCDSRSLAFAWPWAPNTAISSRWCCGRGYPGDGRAGSGLGAGLRGGAAAGSLLAGVKPADAVTFSTAAALCFVTTLLGTVVPALRAIRFDPTTIMRAE